MNFSTLSFGKRDHDPFQSVRPSMGSSSSARPFNRKDRTVLRAHGVPSLNLRPAAPTKRAPSAPPRMKRESPELHVERASSGIRVEQEPDQSVINRMKNEANFHIEYFQWGIMALVLMAFSIIGGHISSLRQNLRKSKQEKFQEKT